MPQVYRYYLVLGCFGAGLSIGLGAFAAHSLKARLSEKMLMVFQTGADYQAYHCLAILVLVGLAASDKSNASTGYFKVALALMLLGMILFSGSLYALSITGMSSLGMITPIGGVLLLIAWAVAIVAVWHLGKQHIDGDRQ